MRFELLSVKPSRSVVQASRPGKVIFQLTYHVKQDARISKGLTPIVMVDVSSSMAELALQRGELRYQSAAPSRMQVVQAAYEKLLTHLSLDEKQRGHCVAFNDHTFTSQLTSLQFRPSGSTDIEKAVSKANVLSREGCNTAWLLLSDGEATSGNRNLKEIASRIHPSVRVFTLDVKDAHNLSDLAVRGAGYVAFSASEIDELVGSILARMRHSESVRLDPQVECAAPFSVLNPTTQAVSLMDGQHYTIFVEVEVQKARSRKTPREVFSIDLAGAGKTTVSLTFAKDAGPEDTSVIEAAEIAKVTTHLLQEAKALAHKGDFTGAAGIMRDVTLTTKGGKLAQQELTRSLSSSLQYQKDRKKLGVVYASASAQSVLASQKETLGSLQLDAGYVNPVDQKFRSAFALQMVDDDDMPDVNSMLT